MTSTMCRESRTVPDTILAPRPMPRSLMAFSQVMPLLDPKNFLLRHRSRSETRSPGGTSSSRSSMRRWAGASSASSTRHRRCVVSSRTRATSRASVVTPGSSTFRSRSQVIASRKIAFGPSPDVHARAATHSASSASASAKSRSPYFRRISC